jgi:hypothetical protein
MHIELVADSNALTKAAAPVLLMIRASPCVTLLAHVSFSRPDNSFPLSRQPRLSASAWFRLAVVVVAGALAEACAVAPLRAAVRAAGQQLAVALAVALVVAPAAVMPAAVLAAAPAVAPAAVVARSVSVRLWGTCCC